MKMFPNNAKKNSALAIQICKNKALAFIPFPEKDNYILHFLDHF